VRAVFVLHKRKQARRNQIQGDRRVARHRDAGHSNKRASERRPREEVVVPRKVRGHSLRKSFGGPNYGLGVDWSVRLGFRHIHMLVSFWSIHPFVWGGLSSDGSTLLKNDNAVWSRCQIRN
jgi:hypothetical protein